MVFIPSHVAPFFGSPISADLRDPFGEDCASELRDPFAAEAEAMAEAISSAVMTGIPPMDPALAQAAELALQEPAVSTIAPELARLRHQHDPAALLFQRLLARAATNAMEDPCEMFDAQPVAQPAQWGESLSRGVRAAAQGAEKRPVRSASAKAGSAALTGGAKRAGGSDPAPKSTPSAPSAPPRITGPIANAKDRELAEIQARAVSSAQTELAAGVREDGKSNRSERIDEYAKAAKMRAGEQWCGYFANWNYRQAAKESGVEWKGYQGVVGKTKARAYFNYRSAVNNSAEKNAELDALKAKHGAEGSQRRYMTLQGSAGDAHAAKKKYDVERYADHKSLPIRGGDMAVFSHGHVGTVESYDPNSGRLTTIEGNTSGGKVTRKTYDLSTEAGRAKFDGFGRMARGDFEGEVKVA